MHLLDVLTTMCVGTMVGVELGVALFIDPVLWRLDEKTQERGIQLFAAVLGRVMPFWYVLGLALLGDEAFQRRDMLTIAAAAIWAAVILFTVTIMVPINNRLARGQSGENTLADHRRWDGLHRVRVVALVAAFGCFLVASGR